MLWECEREGSDSCSSVPVDFLALQTDRWTMFCHENNALYYIYDSVLSSRFKKNITFEYRRELKTLLTNSLLVQGSFPVRFQRSCGVSFPADIQKLFGHGPGSSSWPSLSRDLDQMPSSSSFQPQPFCDTVKTFSVPTDPDI